jgi:glyoxalase family protein
MDHNLLGIHHITAIAGDPQRNLDFYTGFLGLRLVKLTVNFDDPSTYHFYFGDDKGTPGTIMTFFPWPDGLPGSRGSGQADAVSFAIGEQSLGFWLERLKNSSVAFDGPFARFDEQVVTLSDPDGLLVELVAAQSSIPAERSRTADIPVEHALRGFHGVTLVEAQGRRTDSFLRETLGFGVLAREGLRTRYSAAQGTSGTFVDVVVAPDAATGSVAVGTVHHVAWRTADAGEQLSWQQRIRYAAVPVTPVTDRRYFTSIYFREPGGVLFEIATDGPGFAVDEESEALGTHLVLPPWLEAQRPALERRLPRLSLPGTRRAA